MTITVSITIQREQAPVRADRLAELLGPYYGSSLGKDPAARRTQSAD
jgi:hypothetical protein